MCFYSRLLFLWIGELISLGAKCKLEHSNLGGVPKLQHPEYMFKVFENNCYLAHIQPLRRCILPQPLPYSFRDTVGMFG